MVGLTDSSLVMGPSCSSTSSTPGGTYSPCCHHGAGSYSNTQVIAVQLGVHSLLGEESAHTGEVHCPRTQPFFEAFWVRATLSVEIGFECFEYERQAFQMTSTVTIAPLEPQTGKHAFSGSRNR